MFELYDDGKLDYGELRKEIHKILCDFLAYELPVQNRGEFDWEYLEYRTDDILRLIKLQGGTIQIRWLINTYVNTYYGSKWEEKKLIGTRNAVCKRNTKAFRQEAL